MDVVGLARCPKNDRPYGCLVHPAQFQYFDHTASQIRCLVVTFRGVWENI